MRLKRPQVLVPAAIAIFVLAALAIVWIGARTGMARRAVAVRVTEAIGLPATIDSMRVGFLPRPSLEIGGLWLAQPTGFGPEPFLEVARIRVTLPWTGLFGGQEFEAVVLTDATARLQVAEGGESNWSQLFKQPAATTTSARPASIWSLGRLGLEGGAIEYEDRSVDSRWRLTGIALAATDMAPATAFPLELRLGGVFGANTIHYALKGRATLDPDVGRYEANGLDFRGWAGGDPMPLAGVELTGRMQRASFESATGVATLDEGSFKLAGIPAEFKGRFDLDAPEMEGEILVITGVFHPRPPAIAFGYPLPATADPDAWQAMQFSVRGRMQEGELHLDPVTGRLDDTKFEGQAVPSKRLVRASVDRIDVNRYLAPATRSASTRQKKVTLEEKIAGLARFDIDAEIRIAEALIGGARVRDTLIRIEREEATP